jgi:hypothetical protein
MGAVVLSVFLPHFQAPRTKMPIAPSATLGLSYDSLTEQALELFPHVLVVSATVWVDIDLVQFLLVVFMLDLFDELVNFLFGWIQKLNIRVFIHVL